MNRTFYAVLLIVTGVLVASGAFAQTDPQFSLYMLNPVYYNPATAGSEGTGRFQLVNRTQYAGYQGTFDDGGTPSTQLFSFNMPLAGIRSGVGFYAINETFGPQSVQSVQAAYAFRLPLKKGTLALGVQGGLHNITINYDRFRYPDPSDPLITTGRFSQARPDISAGIYYSTETYYIGASMKHLNRPTFALGTERGADLLNSSAYLTAGYRYQWNDALELMPSLIYQYVASPTPSVDASSFQVGLMAFYDKKYWAGLAYRRSDAFTATAGISFLRNNALRFGYAFDFVVTNQLGKSPTSHEVLLSYSLPEPRTGRKPIIRTPRFRY